MPPNIPATVTNVIKFFFIIIVINPVSLAYIVLSRRLCFTPYACARGRVPHFAPPSPPRAGGGGGGGGGVFRSAHLIGRPVAGGGGGGVYILVFPVPFFLLVRDVVFRTPLPRL